MAYVVYYKIKLNPAQSHFNYELEFCHSKRNTTMSCWTWLCTSNIDLRALKDKGRDQVGIKPQNFKLCPDVFSEVNDEMDTRVHANVIRI